MSGAEIALDTNQAIAVLNAAGDAADWVMTFALVYLPVPVIGELRFGALNSGHSSQNLDRIEQLVSRCQVLNATVRTTEAYARIRLQLKQKGKPVPENALWIAALCVEHDLPLATSDEHFAAVDELAVVER